MSTTTTLRRTPCSARHATIASALQLVWVALAVLAGTPTHGLTALGTTGSVAWLISGGVLLIDALHRRLTGRAGERCTHCADLNLPALQPRHHTRRRLLRAWHPAQPLTSGLRVAATTTAAAALLAPTSTATTIAWTALSGLAAAELIGATLHWYHCRRLTDCPDCRPPITAVPAPTRSPRPTSPTP